ncbi:MAG: hypothetical protein ABIQ11_08095 [Saprospiraceae bacterium]
MKREQSYYVFGAIILLAVMFWGFDTTPSTQKTLEKSRVLSGKSFDIHSLESDARTKLTKENLNHLETLQSQAQFAGADSSGLKFLKDLSAFWFNQGNPILAGAYAKQVAEVEQTATSWSITGTTFALVLSQPDLNL